MKLVRFQAPGNDSRPIYVNAERVCYVKATDLTENSTTLYFGRNEQLIVAGGVEMTTKTLQL